MSDLEKRIEDAKRRQEKGTKLETLENQLPDETTDREPTLYEKSAEMIVKKLFAPANMHETQIVSKIPQQILTNIMTMQAIEHGMHAMIDGPTIEIQHDGKDTVIIYDKLKTKDGKEVDVVRKKMGYNQYRRAKLYTQFMTGFTSNLLEELPAVSGKPGDTRAEQGITAIASLTNSERMLLEAQNQSNAGVLKKIWRKVF